MSNFSSLLVTLLILLSALNQNCGTEVGNGEKLPGAKKKNSSVPGEEVTNDAQSPGSFLATAAEYLFNNCRSPLADAGAVDLVLKITATTSGSGLGQELSITSDNAISSASNGLDVYYSYEMNNDAGSGGIKIIATTATDLSFRNFTCGNETTSNSGSYKKHSIQLTDSINYKTTLDWYMDESLSPAKLVKVEVTTATPILTFTNTDYD